MTPQKLIFLHIPKTAGSSFHTVLNRRFRPAEIYNIFASKHESPDVHELSSMSPDELDRIAIIKGHQPFGLHKYLPGDVKYISVLRDPIKRVVSQYHYILADRSNPLYEPIVSNNWSISDFVNSGISVGMNNGQVRWLTGDIDRMPFGDCGEEHYHAALSNLDEYFLWCGLTERFDESVLLLSHLLGWKKPPNYINHNVAKNTTTRAILSQAEIELIRAHNLWDIELYSEVDRRLTDSLQKHGITPAMVTAYQDRNALLSKMLGWLPDRLMDGGLRLFSY